MNNITEEERARNVAHHRKMADQTHHISTLDKLPTTAHYAAMVQESRTRDDTYGGSYTDTYLQYVAFDSEEALNYWVIEQAKDTYFLKKKYQVFFVRPVSIKLHTTIEIEKS